MEPEVRFDEERPSAVGPVEVTRGLLTPAGGDGAIRISRLTIAGLELEVAEIAAHRDRSRVDPAALRRTAADIARGYGFSGVEELRWAFLAETGVGFGDWRRQQA